MGISERTTQHLCALRWHPIRVIYLVFRMSLFLNTLAVSQSLDCIAARLDVAGLDVNRTAGSTLWDYWDQVLYDYNRQ